MAPVSGVRLTVDRRSPRRDLLGHGAGLRRRPVPARRARDRRVAAGPSRRRARHRGAGDRRRRRRAPHPSSTAGRRSRYDTASFDVGSTVSGLDLPGVREHALPTRPIADLVARVEALVARCAGATGRASSWSARARAASSWPSRSRRGCGREGVRDGRRHAARARAGHPAPAIPAAPRRRASSDSARARGIEIRCGARVAEVAADHVRLDTGERARRDAVVWVAGAASLPLFRDSGLPTDERGFVRVRPTLQVAGHDELFAVGDCASLEGHPALPKAGVYAVRQGPVLIHNLRARIERRRAPPLPAPVRLPLAPEPGRRARHRLQVGRRRGGARGVRASRTGSTGASCAASRCWRPTATVTPEFAGRAADERRSHALRRLRGQGRRVRAVARPRAHRRARRSRRPARPRRARRRGRRRHRRAAR